MSNRWLCAVIAGVTVFAALPSAAEPATGRMPGTAQAGGAASGFVLPVAAPPRILTPFRPPAVVWGAGHRGVDLAAGVGSQVRSAGPGIVVFAGTLAGRGVVSIQHGGTLRTTYEPLDPAVSTGDQVGAGRLIGTVRAGHPSCLPAVCLHWGARIGRQTYVDPMMLITGWRVRLLPWEGD